MQLMLMSTSPSSENEYDALLLPGGVMNLDKLRANQPFFHLFCIKRVE